MLCNNICKHTRIYIVKSDKTYNKKNSDLVDNLLEQNY